MELTNKTVIGVTGGVASGKTTAASLILGYDADVVDADEVSRKLSVSGGELERKMASAFPDALSDGFIDRLKLRKIVFGSKSQLEKLNSLTRQEIKKKVEAEIAASQKSLVFLIVPLMFESGFDELCDRVITVSCPVEVRIERLKKRDGISTELAKKMIAAQMTDEEREKFSDYTVSSNCSEEEFKKRFNSIVEELVKAFKD